MRNVVPSRKPFEGYPCMEQGAPRPVRDEERTAARNVAFAIQYLCLIGLLATYAAAIAAPSALIGFYGLVVSSLPVAPGWLQALEIELARFPQAAAHSALTAIFLATAYASALLRIPALRHRRISWNPQDARTLADGLREQVISKVLVRPLASYVTVNNAQLFAPIVLTAPVMRTAAAPKAWMAFITSRPALSVVALELFIAYILLIGLDGEGGRRSVSDLRYFTSNTLAIFMACSIGFKGALAAVSFVQSYLRGSSNGN